MSKNNLIVLEVRGRSGWIPAAEVRLIENPSRGGFAATNFEYLIDYATLETPFLPSVSLRYPVGLEQHSLNSWPAFLFDLVPSGAARRFWITKLNLGEGPHSDWVILTTGAFNPPGCVRIKRNERNDPVNSQPDGFSASEVVMRTPEFLSYIEEYGGPVKGATGAGGDAPKYLLREDAQHRYHADLALSDDLTKNCWLVKYPRGSRSAADIEVLRGEELYSRLTIDLGLKANASPLRYEEIESCQALFVPRMDRIPGQKMTYLGLESLYSAAGICGWPIVEKHANLARAVLEFSNVPDDDVVEYFLRDLANMIFGNTDNHGRNSALLVTDSSVTLSPIFDFAPMFLDPEGITRTVRWQGERSGHLSLAELLNEAGVILEDSGLRVKKQDFRDKLIHFVQLAGKAMEQIFDEANGLNRLKARLQTISLPYLRSLESECLTL